MSPSSSRVKHTQTAWPGSLTPWKAPRLIRVNSPKERKVCLAQQHSGPAQGLSEVPQLSEGVTLGALPGTATLPRIAELLCPGCSSATEQESSRNSHALLWVVFRQAELVYTNSHFWRSPAGKMG